MKIKTLIILILGTLMFAACGTQAPASQDQVLVYAQQTLDALNASVGQDQPIATVAPQSNSVQPVATAVPQSNTDTVSAGDANSAGSGNASAGFAGAVGQWEFLDTDLSYQTLSFVSNADGSYAFQYTDQGASTCGLDPNNNALNALTFSGTGLATNNIFHANQVQGVCEGTGKTIVVDLQYAFQADSNTIMDGSGIVWKQRNSATGSKQSEPTGERINLFDAIDGAINFPANQAFHIEHGWSYDAGNPAQNVFATSDFALVLDHQALPLDTVRVLPDDSGNAGSINWVYNFPNGLTGTHSFSGIWTAPCAVAQSAANCNDPNATVESEPLEVTINFSP